jgi:hypothetical protein
MSGERCPRDGYGLQSRTNGIGLAYLECGCGYIEPVHRRADPFPDPYCVTRYPNGTVRRRRSDYRTVEEREFAALRRQRRGAA